VPPLACVPKDGARATIGVHDSVGDSSGVPWEWLARWPPLSDVLIMATTSWLTSWCHCFASDSEAPGPRGLRRSVRVASSVPSGPAPEGTPSWHPPHSGAHDGRDERSLQWIGCPPSR
jgi:hypothetical protein